MLQEFFEEIITQSDVGMENSNSEDEGIQSGEETEEEEEILKGINMKGNRRLRHMKGKKRGDTKEEEQDAEEGDDDDDDDDDEEEEEEEEEEEAVEEEDDEEAIDEWEEHLAEIPKLKVRSSKSYLKLSAYCSNLFAFLLVLFQV